MILIEPPNSELSIVTTAHILSVIDKHASSTALILLPGVQYYTGQCFDIKTITAHAHSHGITIGWDLAHAAGNVELQLHDWNVDFAAWCNYKYINSGPGAIASLFVHEKHGTVQKKAGSISYRPRLSGWWGGDKATRFEMGNRESTPFSTNLAQAERTRLYNIHRNLRFDLLPIQLCTLTYCTILTPTQASPPSPAPPATKSATPPPSP